MGTVKTTELSEVALEMLNKKGYASFNTDDGQVLLLSRSLLQKLLDSSEGKDSVMLLIKSSIQS